jgi:protein SCO1/2
VRSAIAAIVLLTVAALAPSAHAAREARLVDQTGRVFSLADLRGTPLVVTFVSAHCKDVCPLVDAQIGQAVADARARDLRVRFVTITLDPERDTIADMKKLARTFDADPRSWLIAGGAVPDVHAVMQAFRVTANRGGDGYADVHTTFVYLVDKHGIVRTSLLASNDLSQQIVSTVQRQWKVLAR